MLKWQPKIKCQVQANRLYTAETAATLYTDQFSSTLLNKGVKQRHCHSLITASCRLIDHLLFTDSKITST